MGVALGQILQPLAAAGAQPRAVGAAQGPLRQAQDQGVAQGGLEIKVGLAHEEEVRGLLVPLLELGGRRLGQEVELVEVHRAVLVQVAQAAHALAVHVHPRAGAHEDSVLHGDQGGVEKDRRALRHADDRRTQARGGGRLAVHGLRGAAGAGQVHDIDDESGHIFLLVRGRRRGGAFAG